MTINEYLENVPDMQCNDGSTLRETMRNTCEIWNNNSCKGYCILSMKESGFDDSQIKTVLSHMRWMFDETSIDQAEQVYIDF